MRDFFKKFKHFLAINCHLPWLYGKISFSQEGEDSVLQKLFAETKKGFYVDVGAHHPYRYSNTFWFYHHGWRGINIDATPGSMKSFETARASDKNVELAISNKKQRVLYYLFADSALNTLSRNAAESVIKNEQSTLIRKEKVKTLPLSAILDKWVPKNKHIDFLSIDVEGSDLQVLQSNNWKKYSPRIVLVEILSPDGIEKIAKHPVSIFLKKQGYVIIARTFNTVFFQKKEK